MLLSAAYRVLMHKKLPYQVQNITYIVLLEFNTEKVEVLSLRELEQFIKKGKQISTIKLLH